MHVNRWTPYSAPEPDSPADVPRDADGEFHSFRSVALVLLASFAIALACALLAPEAPSQFTFLQ